MSFFLCRCATLYLSPKLMYLYAFINLKKKKKNRGNMGKNVMPLSPHSILQEREEESTANQ